MKIVGIAGGVASGKSMVAGALAKWGAAFIDVDQIGHVVLGLSEIRHAARRRWGDRIFRKNDEIDRKKLAGIVFGDIAGKELSVLESMMFPAIRIRLEQELTRLRTQKVAVTVVDAAVMFKARWDSLCDVIVFVDSTVETRLSRARARGWSAEEFSAREAAQVPLEAKRQRSDVTIDNNGSVDKTIALVEQFWLSLDSFPSQE